MNSKNRKPTEKELIFGALYLKHGGDMKKAIEELKELY